jgi:hypothetical protein
MTALLPDLLWKLAPLIVALLVIQSLFGSKRRKSPSKRQDRMARSGIAGERMISAAITARGLPALHDILLPYKGTVTQIDHVVATGRGLVVIETKNFAGLVLGKPRDRNWTQVSSGGKKRPFLNPILQNRMHELATIAAAGGSTIEGLVVFAGSAKFPKGLPAGVVHVSDLPALLAARGLPAGRELAAFESVRRIAVLHDTAHHKAMHAAAVARHA